MSTLTPALSLLSRPAWDTDRWVRDFFGPATAKVTIVEAADFA